RSLQGLVLKSRINLSNIFTNRDVVAYSKNTLPEEHFDAVLHASQRHYLMNLLLNTFDWNELTEKVKSTQEMVNAGNIADKDPAIEFLKVLAIANSMHREIAEKFKIQFNNLIGDPSNIDYLQIETRTQKAVEWFVSKLEAQVIDPLENHIKMWSAKKRTKKYVEDLKELLVAAYRKISRLQKCIEISSALAQENELPSILEKAKDFHTIKVEIDSKQTDSQKESSNVLSTKKASRGETKNISLAFFSEGKTIHEIANIRGLTAGTITNHLLSFIGNGVEVEQLIDLQKLKGILLYIEKNPNQSTYDLKNGLGSECSYTDIKIALQVRANHHSPLLKDH